MYLITAVHVLFILPVKKTDTIVPLILLTKIYYLLKLKIMKKVLLIGSIIIAGCIGANAQKGFTFGLGVNFGLPVGDASDISSFTLGGEAQGEYKFNSAGSLVFTSGYTHFFGKDLGLGVKVNYGAVPVLAGARYYPSKKFFGGAQEGYAFFTGDASDGGFAYKPQIGCDAGPLQLALSYNAITNDGTIGWIGLSGIFKFSAGKSVSKK